MGTVAAREPVVWWILGYPFQAGPMVVCLMAVLITRVVIGLQAKSKGQFWLDVAIILICMLVTVLWVQAHQMDLLAAGLTGIGIGATGTGIIGFAKSAVVDKAKQRFADALDAFMGTNNKP
jgi:hypothetical protein